MFKVEDQAIEKQIFEWKKENEKEWVDKIQNLRDYKKMDPAFLTKIKKLYGATSIDALDND